MSFLEMPKYHSSFLLAQQKAAIAPATLIPIAAGLNPLIVLLEPRIDMNALWGIINASAPQGVGAVFNALEANASQVITSPSFEAQIFAMGCRVAANLWDHGAMAIIAPPPASATSGPTVSDPDRTLRATED
jgi:hypothetical protein